MQSGKTCFSNGIDILDVSFSMLVHHHTAAAVMCCGDNRNLFPGNVDAILQAAFMNHGKVFENK